LKHQQKYQINRNKKCFLSKEEKLLHNICIKKDTLVTCHFAQLMKNYYFLRNFNTGEFDHKETFMITSICKNMLPKIYLFWISINASFWLVMILGMLSTQRNSKLDAFDRKLTF